MLEFQKVNWPAAKNVHALTTTRQGGNSSGIYRSFNLGSHVDDYIDAVELNRILLQNSLNLPSQPVWLNQVHGVNIVCADKTSTIVDADGSYTTIRNCVCAVLTADCLPVFISDIEGRIVGVFHAGWRGLVNGILENAIAIMTAQSKNLIAAFGPAISQNSFEVGPEVKFEFESKFDFASQYFKPAQRHNHFYADLYGLAQAQLLQLGVSNVYKPEAVCTFNQSDRYYSYRRDGQTGRMASLIWINDLDHDKNQKT